MKKEIENKVVYFWDTSALAAFLFEERFSRPVREYSRSKKAIRGFLSFFSKIEMESVFQRRLNRGDVEEDQRQDFRVQLNGILTNMRELYADSQIVEQTKRMINEYSLRSADALLLATARTLGTQFEQIVFLSLDDKLNRSARAEGMEAPFLEYF